MDNVIDTIPPSLKAQTITALSAFYNQEIIPHYLPLQEKFHSYEFFIRDELADYIARKDVVSEIDVILEEARIKKRIGEEFPEAGALMEKFNDLTLKTRRGECEIQKVFMAQNGTVEQFKALKKAMGAAPLPWWKGPV